MKRMCNHFSCNVSVKKFEAHDIEFDFALSGEEALDYLKSKRSEIVLILSDINMPGMSGIDLLSKIRHDYLDPATCSNDDHGIR